MLATASAVAKISSAGKVPAADVEFAEACAMAARTFPAPVARPLFWSLEDTPALVAEALDALADEFPFRRLDAEVLEAGAAADDGKARGAADPARRLRFRPAASLSVHVENDGIVVEHPTTAAALRGAGLALAGLSVRGEARIFDAFGVMLDCSRNAVPTVATLQAWLRRLALLGYDLAFLYTEDTYELPDEPHFGHLRGAYSAGEIRAVDDYARRLGIEVAGCIQTLGHLNTFLSRQGAELLRDTGAVLLADDHNTHALLDKMIAFWRDNLRSRRIHVGMDETHDLGRGRYLDRHGVCDRFGIFNRHLQQVTERCRAAGLRPLLWSDMYYRLGSARGDYYDPEACIPEQARAAIPPDAQLVYWDYYHQESAFYESMIDKHRELGGEPWMASGLWTWYRFAYDHGFTVRRAEPCLEACRRRGVRNFFFTMWGDDGAYADFGAALAGLQWAADRAHARPTRRTADRRGRDAARAERHLRALGGGSFRQVLALGKLHPELPGYDNGVSCLPIMVWDDPLLGIGWRYLDLDNRARCDALLSAWREGTAATLNERPYARAAARLALAKTELRARLLEAAHRDDRVAARRLRMEKIPEVRRRLEEFAALFRIHWLARNKPAGMEAMQLRLGGLEARCRELGERLAEWEDGRSGIPPELSVPHDARCRPRRRRYVDFAAACVL